MSRQRTLNRRGMMHVGEWAILLGLVVTAFLTVQVYLRRALQARVIAASDAFTTIRANFNATGGGVSLNANFAGMNAGYRSVIPKDFPARATVKAGLVGADGLVEIMFVAAK